MDGDLIRYVALAMSGGFAAASICMAVAAMLAARRARKMLEAWQASDYGEDDRGRGSSVGRAPLS